MPKEYHWIWEIHSQIPGQPFSYCPNASGSLNDPGSGLVKEMADHFTLFGPVKVLDEGVSVYHWYNTCECITERGLARLGIAGDDQVHSEHDLSRRLHDPAM